MKMRIAILAAVIASTSAYAQQREMRKNNAASWR